MERLREGQRIQVRVIPHTHYEAGWGPGMEEYDEVTIRWVREDGNRFGIIEDNGDYNWSLDMCLEYQVEKELERLEAEAALAELIPIGTFVRTPQIDEDYLLKVHSHNPQPNHKYKLKVFNVKGRKSRNNIGVEADIHEDQLVSVLNDDYLQITWGVKNIVAKAEDKKPIVDFFKDCEYPVKKLAFKHETVKYNQHCFILAEDKSNPYSVKRTIATIINGKLMFKTNVSATLSVDVPDRKEALMLLCKAKIKSCDESIKLFLHPNKKREMLKASIEEKKTFPITNVHYDYEKNGEKCHVLEVFNGEISLKFKLDDIEIVFPNLKGITLPKDRTISKDTVCKVSNNKHLPVTRNCTVKVLEMTNISRYKSRESAKKYNKSTIVKVVSEDGKTFNCKIKNLKKI